MEHYVGLDVSLKLTAICVVDQTGSVIREGMVNSAPETIAEFVTSNAPSVSSDRASEAGRRRPRGCGLSSSNLASATLTATAMLTCSGATPPATSRSGSCREHKYWKNPFWAMCLPAGLS